MFYVLYCTDKATFRKVQHKVTRRGEHTCSTSDIVIYFIGPSSGRIGQPIVASYLVREDREEKYNVRFVLVPRRDEPCK